MPVTTTGVGPGLVVASAKVLEIIALANANETGLVTTVKTTGAQSVAGVKTFTSIPVVPADSFPVAATIGLQTALDGKAASVHGHSAADVTSGLLNLARLPAGSILTVIKARGDFGAAPGAWPVARPTARTDITVYWEGNTDPGGIVGAYDKWLVTT